MPLEIVNQEQEVKEPGMKTFLLEGSNLNASQNAKKFYSSKVSSVFLLKSARFIIPLLFMIQNGSERGIAVPLHADTNDRDAKAHKIPRWTTFPCLLPARSTNFADASLGSIADAARCEDSPGWVQDCECLEASGDKEQNLWRFCLLIERLATENT